MLKVLMAVTTAGAVVGLVITTSPLALAQAPADPHHPAGAAPPATTKGAAPTQQHMPGGMMGPGMMGGGMMGPGMMSGAMGGGMMEMMANCQMIGGGASHAEGRVAFLRAELAISDAQKAVWEAYAAQIKKNMQGMQDMQSMMMSMMNAKTPVDRISARIAAMDKRAQALKEIKPTLEALYASLSAEQKGKADQVLTGMGCMM
jgi:predicted lipid-binding transport protein (Tim44 family)